MRLRWAQSAAAFLFTAGLAFLLCDYIADFPLRQSVVLALVIAGLVHAVRHNAKQPLLRFSPYNVFIRPTWSQILIDYHLIAKPEDWQLIEHSLKKLPLDERSALRYGIHFTIVHQSDDFERTLIYWNHDHSFASEIDFEEEMVPIKAKREVEIPMLGDYDFYFFAKWAVDGYNLGIVVPDSWWHTKKQMCPKPFMEVSRHPTGQVELVLATIPYREFDVYWKPVEWNSAYNENTIKRRDAYRVKFAWAAIIDEDDAPELALDLPEGIYHKYFEVKHRAV